MEPISLNLRPLLALSLLPSSSSPQNLKLLFPSSLRTLALKKLQSFSNGGLPISSKVFGQRLVCSSSIGSVLMSTSTAVSVSKAKVSPFLWTLAGNPTFVSGLVAWVLAQSMKVFLNFFVEKRWDPAMLVNSGGMPSSHSALCTALTTSVAFCHGVGDSLFPVCLWFSLIVMYDAIGVRRHAGMQAEVLNKIIEDLFQGHPISQRKLKELLGHTPSQKKREKGKKRKKKRRDSIPISSSTSWSLPSPIDTWVLGAGSSSPRSLPVRWALGATAISSVSRA